MSAPGTVSITTLEAWDLHPEARPFPTSCYRCLARVFCHDTRRQTLTSRTFGALFSPGDPYSVVLPYQEEEDVRIIADPVPVSAPSWYGVPCQFVRLRIGLPIVGSSAPRPFRLLALLPLEEIEDVPPLLRLGAEFLHANHASVSLSTTPREGWLLIPY
jgi:hypothetical protein